MNYIGEANLIVIIILIEIIIIVVVIVIKVIVVVIKEVIILIIEFRDVISFVVHKIFFDLDCFDRLILFIKIKFFEIFILKVEIFVLFEKFVLVITSVNFVHKQII